VDATSQARFAASSGVTAFTQSSLYSAVTLSPRAQTAVTLTSLAGMQGIANQVGRLTLTTTSGAFTALGLRFTGSALTSIPAAYR
jgi:hypothetical protein